MFKGRLTYTEIMNMELIELDYLSVAQEELLTERAKQMNTNDQIEELEQWN